MSDTSNAFHAFGEDPDSSLGADNSARWVPTPWQEFATDLSSPHPNLQVTGFITNGGMGAIYKAVDITDAERKPLAIKTLRWDELDNLELKERFQKEILTLRLLKHPHICELKEIGEDAKGDPIFNGETASGVPFFVMPRYQGRTLEYYTQGARLPVPRALRLMEQLCSATAYSAENGVVHRDLKPANIFLVDPDERARILDYGVARTLSPAAGVFTRTGMIAGTIGYHAPEVLAGRPAGTTADVYSLGLILYKLLTGALPEGIPIPVADHGHDPRFDPILAKALRPDPADRYPSAAAFSDALKAIAAPSATPPPLPNQQKSSNIYISKNMSHQTKKTLTLTLLSLFLIVFFITIQSNISKKKELILEANRKVAVSNIESIRDTIAVYSQRLDSVVYEKELFETEHRKFLSENKDSISAIESMRKLAASASEAAKDKSTNRSAGEKLLAGLTGGALTGMLTDPEFKIIEDRLKNYTITKNSLDTRVSYLELKINDLKKQISIVEGSLN